MSPGKESPFNLILMGQKVLMHESSLPFSLPLLSDEENIIFVLSVYSLLTLSKVEGFSLAGREAEQINVRVWERETETEAGHAWGKGESDEVWV